MPRKQGEKPGQHDSDEEVARKRLAREQRARAKQDADELEVKLFKASAREQLEHRFERTGTTILCSRTSNSVICSEAPGGTQHKMTVHVECSLGEMLDRPERLRAELQKVVDEWMQGIKATLISREAL